MSGAKRTAIIGRGFGDEGKGMAADWLCSHAPGSLVIKHNGGAQAGHTVEHPGLRFVFHQLSAGSFQHADTYWADTYFPDLYKLGEEADAFKTVAGFLPKIYCDPQVSVVLIDDVIMNMGIETLRGSGRHGSCGMGINEADLRTKAGFGISVKELLSSSAGKLAGKMMEIRREYQKKRLEELQIQALPGEYQELLESPAVIENAAEEMCRNCELLELKEAEKLLPSRERIVFESGQGLLLDAECVRYSPHVTASRTGLTNPVRLLARCGLSLDEVVYVTRSYVTRHGAGPLPCERTRQALGISAEDRTNRPNPWQGTLRYALYESPAEMIAPVLEDLARVRGDMPQVSLLVTHLNETKGHILFPERRIPAEELPQLPELCGAVDRFYRSDSRFSSEIRAIR